MTQEEIKQEAERYAYGTDFDKLSPIANAYQSFLAGAFYVINKHVTV